MIILYIINHSNMQIQKLIIKWIHITNVGAHWEVQVDYVSFKIGTVNNW